ncbi:MAG: DNA polymerase III epsilon subunit-like protein [Myxococcota bacterium]|jgi:DNA polymerase III epsilon subunit-like protein
MTEALTLTAPAQKSRYKGKAQQPRGEMLRSLRPATELKRAVPTPAAPALSPQDRWRAKFSDAQGRLIIRGIRRLAATLAAPMLRKRATLLRIEEAQDQVSEFQKDRLRLLLAAIELEEGGEDAAVVKDLRAQAADKARQIRRIESAATSARRKRYEQMAHRPSGWRLLDDLDRTLTTWRQRVNPWPSIAGLIEEAARCHETVLGIVADHAVAWVWRGDAPKQWLSYAGYTPAKDPVQLRRAEDEMQVVCTIQHVDLLPPIPVGTVLSTLTSESMSLPERAAVDGTRKGRRKANEQLWQQWIDQMRDSLSAEDLAAYEKRAPAWRDTGWAGKRAAGDWLVGLVARTGLEKPKLLPRFVCVRWPVPEDGPAPEDSLRYLDVGRDAVVLSDEEILAADIEAGETPEPQTTPAPMIFEAPIAYIDTETTGMLNDPLAEVIEIGAVILDRWGNEIGHFNELARPWHNPHRPTALAALNVSGIKTAELRAARPIAEVAADFQAWLTSWNNPVCIAYNVGFDKAMLKRHGIEATWGRCAMHLARRVRTGSAKLELLSGDWGLRTEAQTHRALDDVRLSVAVLIETLRRLEAAAKTDPKQAKALAKFRASLIRPPATPGSSP